MHRPLNDSNMIHEDRPENDSTWPVDCRGPESLNEAMMKYCGIDLHSNNSVVVITDEGDTVLVSRRCANDLEIILALLKPHEAELVGVVVESTSKLRDFVQGVDEIQPPPLIPSRSP